MSNLISNIDSETAKHKRKKAAKDIFNNVINIGIFLVVFGVAGWAAWTYVLKPSFAENEASSKKLQEDIEKNKKSLGR